MYRNCLQRAETGLPLQVPNCMERGGVFLSYRGSRLTPVVMTRGDLSTPRSAFAEGAN